MKNSVRRGLFHPDDIKIVGLTATGPGPLSAPLPSLNRKTSRHSLSPVGTLYNSSSSGSGSHSRSASLVAGSGGSFGRADARQVQNQAEFGKYAEDDDEDYEDVFGKPNGTSERNTLIFAFRCLLRLRSDRAFDADTSTEHSLVKQIMGMIHHHLLIVIHYIFFIARG